MCTSFTINKTKTLVGWNLDILGMEYRVRPTDEGVYIEINDSTEGWIPIFGANSRGEFVGMPTCHPFDARSNPAEDGPLSIMLCVELLTKQKTFEEIKTIAEEGNVYSVPGVTYMCSMTDAGGNVLHIIPGQGYKYYERPEHVVLTNFSPFKGDAEKHPWMGLDRYQTADKMLFNAKDDFDISDCFKVLEACSQELCPTVVSMVYDVTKREVYWCENRQFECIEKKKFHIDSSVE